jgi:hypothetical protein
MLHRASTNLPRQNAMICTKRSRSGRSSHRANRERPAIFQIFARHPRYLATKSYSTCCALVTPAPTGSASTLPQPAPAGAFCRRDPVRPRSLAPSGRSRVSTLPTFVRAWPRVPRTSRSSTTFWCGRSATLAKIRCFSWRDWLMPLYAAAIVDYCDVREIGIADAQIRTKIEKNTIRLGSAENGASGVSDELPAERRERPTDAAPIGHDHSCIYLCGAVCIVVVGTRRLRPGFARSLKANLKNVKVSGKEKPRRTAPSGFLSLPQDRIINGTGS